MVEEDLNHLVWNGRGGFQLVNSLWSCCFSFSESCKIGVFIVERILMNSPLIRENLVGGFREVVRSLEEAWKVVRFNVALWVCIC